MHTKEPKEDPLVDLGYEVRDINTKTIERAVMWFFTFATVMFVSGALIYANINPGFTPGYKQPKMILPQSPNPTLQTNSTNVTDIMSLRQKETKELTTTGYTDATHTAVHIPIDRAIAILAKRGLPVTSGDIPAVSKGNTTDERKYNGVGQADASPTSNPEQSPNMNTGFMITGAPGDPQPQATSTKPATTKPKH